MRHLVKGKRLGRDVPHRKATLRSLSIALIKEHRIVTTVSKAKELRGFFEPLVTKAKEDTSHNRRQVFSTLQNKKAVSLLFDEVAKKAKDRPGGYTRVIKAGFRSGDGAEMAVMELVDYNDIKPEDKGKKKRTRRAGKSKKTTSSKPEQKSSSKRKEKTEEKEEVEAKAKPEEVEEQENAEDAKAESEEAEAEPADSEEGEDEEK